MLRGIGLGVSESGSWGVRGRHVKIGDLGVLSRKAGKVVTIRGRAPCKNRGFGRALGQSFWGRVVGRGTIHGGEDYLPQRHHRDTGDSSPPRPAIETHIRGGPICKFSYHFSRMEEPAGFLLQRGAYLVSVPRKRQPRSQKSYDKTGLLPRAGRTRYTIRLNCYQFSNFPFGGLDKQQRTVILINAPLLDFFTREGSLLIHGGSEPSGYSVASSDGLSR